MILFSAGENHLRFGDKNPMTEKPFTEKPFTEKPLTGNPSTGNPTSIARISAIADIGGMSRIG